MLVECICYTHNVRHALEKLRYEERHRRLRRLEFGCCDVRLSVFENGSLAMKVPPPRKLFRSDSEQMTVKNVESR